MPVAGSGIDTGDRSLAYAIDLIPLFPAATVDAQRHRRSTDWRLMSSLRL
jgi:hypothetical protein